MLTAAETCISEIGTIGVPVADQDRAIAFYAGKLGFDKRIDAPYAKGQRWVEVAPAGAGTSIALVRAEPGQTGVDTQIRLTSADTLRTHALFRTLGISVDADVAMFPVPMFAFRDADGNSLLVVQRA